MNNIKIQFQEYFFESNPKMKSNDFYFQSLEYYNKS